MLLFLKQKNPIFIMTPISELSQPINNEFSSEENTSAQEILIKSIVVKIMDAAFDFAKGLYHYRRGKKFKHLEVICFKLAAKHFQKAADQNISKAQLFIADCYQWGHGVSTDYLKAAKYFKLAADKGLSRAQYAIGRYYIEGDVIEKNIDKGLEYLQKAADQNVTDAQSHLGYLLYKGKKMEPDFIKAEIYLKKAAAKDDEYAQKILCHKKFRKQLLEQQLYDP